MTEADPQAGPSDGWQDDYEKFYLSMYERLVGRAINANCPRDDAEDCVEEVLIRIWERWHLIEPETRANYAMKAVGHEVIQRHRRTRRASDLLAKLRGLRDRSELELAGDGVEAMTIDDFEALRVQKYLESVLPARTRQVVLLRRDGYTTGEIASLMEISESTVRGLLKYARDKLRDYPEGRSLP